MDRTGTPVEGLELKSGSKRRFTLSIAECVEFSDEQGKGKAIQEIGGVDKLASLLHVDLRQGILGDLDEELLERTRIYGENKVPEPKPKSYFRLLYEAMQDVTMLILCAAAVVSLILALVHVEATSNCDNFDHHTPSDVDEHDSSTEMIDALAILLAVVIVANVTAFNDWQKEKQFQKLNEASRNTSVFQVSRQGFRQDVQVQNLVVGDIVHVSTGTKIPTDGVLATGDNLSCDESAVTGETDLMEKLPGDYLKTGAMVSEGGGSLLVTGVGPNTDAGKAIEILSDSADLTPLQVKLNRMATLIGYGGMFMACLTFVSVCIRFAICRVEDETPFEGKELLILFEYVVLGITIVVVAVPEGLPLAVTISLAYSMRKMMLDNNLVRKLQACETMGGVTDICSDKTGTLTENQMTVTRGVLLGKEVDGFWTSRTSDGEIESKLGLQDEQRKQLYGTLLEAMSVNTSDASFVRPDLDKKGVWETLGSKTECALLLLCIQLGKDFDKMRKDAEPQRTGRLNFTSDRKRMSTITAIGEGASKQTRVFTTGAAEIVLELCNRSVDPAAGIIKMDDKLREEHLTQMRSMTSQGLRSLCIAYKDTPESPVTDEEVESGLCLLAIVGIKDPLRKAVPGAVASCKRAGIRVRMVTGDNLETASHIARECGILDDSGIVMEGKEFRELTPAQMNRILPNLQVLARSKPTDKHTLVHALREQGAVVAVTGDGTNDAPALKEADVGLSMGLSGTDVAKKASDIVILDDNFASIVRAIQWGRNVYDSIRKFLQFQLTVNVAALFIAYMGAVIQASSPLKPIHLLWVNLIMDTLAALALATEEPNDSQLERAPYGRYESLVNGRMWLTIFGQSILQCTVLMVMLFYGDEFYMDGDVCCREQSEFDAMTSTEEKRFKNTMIFNTFVFFQLWNEINSRVLGTQLNVFSGFLKNNLFIGVMFITLGCQIAIIQGLGTVFNVTRLNVTEFVICVGIGFLSLPCAALLKLLPVPAILTRFEHGTGGTNPNRGSVSPLNMTDMETASRYSLQADGDPMGKLSPVVGVTL